MYTYVPQRKNKAHVVLPLFLFSICLCIVTASQTSNIIPPSIMQFLGVVGVVVAIQIISRYSMCSFTYTADSTAKKLSVTKTTGKKSMLVADLDYNTIISIDKKEKGYSPKTKYNKPYKVYNFCLNIFPADAYYLICKIDENDIAVIIEANDILLRHITDTKDKLF